MAGKTWIEPPQHLTPPKYAFNNPDELKAFVSGAGFEQVQVIPDELDFRYADENEWLNTQWSHGARAVLESIPEQVFEAMKPTVFANIQALKQPDGIHQLFRVFYTFAVKPISD